MERRRHPRASASLLVERHEEGVTYFHTTWDVGGGGVFLLRAHEIPLPETMDLLVHLPDGGLPIRARGIVTHRVEGDGSRSGYGVRLVDVALEDALRLARWVGAHAEEEAAGLLS